MNATPRMRPHTFDVPAVPADSARDFIAVDDSGDFTYHRSEHELVAAFEYVEEARSIIDRNGTDYRLALDANRHLVLGPALGPVEFHWLRQAWRSARKVHMEEHRLQRFYPGARDQLLRDLFEVLALERGTDPGAGAWTVDIEGERTRLHKLQEVDRLLSGPVQLEQAHMQDPFGRMYRPVRHRKHWYLPAAVGFILYVEVPQHGGTLPAHGRPVA